MKHTATVTVMYPNGVIIHVEKIHEFSLHEFSPRELTFRPLPMQRRTLKQRITDALVRVDPFRDRGAQWE